MTAQEISKQVQEQADARFGDTIERLLSILRTKHTHQCWRRECDCEYCQFINGQYVDAKLNLHRIKKRINFYEYIWNLTEEEMFGMMSIQMRHGQQKQYIRNLKELKKELQGNVL